MRRLSAAIRLDPGWLYLGAGLTLCAAAFLVPAQRELHGLRRGLQRLRHETQIAGARVQARQAFLEQLRRGDPVLLRRLAAAQLNLLPAEGTPLLAAGSRDATIAEWIDRTVEVTPPPLHPMPDTRLSRLTAGRRRLWVLACGVLAIFAGVLLDGRDEPAARPRARRRALGRPAGASALRAPPATVFVARRG